MIIEVEGKNELRQFQFHNIDELIVEGVSDAQLQQLVREANRYRVCKEGSLDKAFFLAEGLPYLEPNYPKRWDDQLDQFIAAHSKNTGAFKIGDSVVYHFCSPNACDWYKQLTGLKAEVTRAWTPEGQPTQYEIELQHNRHVCVCTEQELIPFSAIELAKPWWCAEIIHKRGRALYVRLAPFENAKKLESELTQFVKNMFNYESRQLHIYGEHDEPNWFRPRVSIEYQTRLTFHTWGKRSNRATAQSLLNDLAMN